jgi:multimeric flavodoxin WrbA
MTDTRKILAINGSHHGDHGLTRFLLDLLFEGAREAGAECDVLTLANLNVNRCIGCDHCQKNVTVPVDARTFTPHCVWDGKDDGRMIFDRIAVADLVIYATPIHVFSMSGLMKNFLDRFYAYGNSSDIRVSEGGLMFHFVDYRYASKPFALLVCCGNLENETPANTIAYFRSFSRFMDAPMVGMLVRNGAEMMGKGKDPTAESRFPRIHDVYAAYRQAGRELATDGKISRRTGRMANREIIPVPLFHLLKRIPIRSIKLKFTGQAARFQNHPASPASSSEKAG